MKDKTYEEGVWDERQRIAKEMRAKPFGWCSVCGTNPCDCNSRPTINVRPGVVRW